MAIDLKAFKRTKYTGLYVAKEKSPLGLKYLGRFQFQNKKYVKVIGYSVKDNLTENRAHQLFLEYKKQVTIDDTVQPKKTVKKEEQQGSFEELYASFKKILKPYFKQGFDAKKIENALKVKAYNELLRPYQIELIKMQEYLNAKNKKMIILFEGRDASGKGGAIRKISRYMNSKSYRIVALGKPSNTQKTQWFFQRYVEQFPIAGEVVLFDRSWYNRAMVEPVFGFCTREEYDSFLSDVNHFEKSIVRNNIILVKLYFSVSKEVQAKRFNRRSKDPLRQWKLSEVDLQSQSLWDAFSEKKYKMLQYSEIEEAPWHIIRADDKLLTRLESIKVILNSIKYPNKNEELNFEYNTSVVCSAEEERRTMYNNDNY